MADSSRLPMGSCGGRRSSPSALADSSARCQPRPAAPHCFNIESPATDNGAPMKPKATEPRPSPGKPGTVDEPEITQEEAVPSDGKDHEGEELMEQLGRERRQKGTGPKEGQ